MKEVQPVLQNPFEAFNPLKRFDHYLFETARNFRSRGNGHAGDMDRLILQKALFELTRWDSLGMQIPRVSVNIQRVDWHRQICLPSCPSFP